ncbi:aldehyde dehydrogenase family protein, partial [Sphingobium terrigena]
MFQQAIDTVRAKGHAPSRYGNFIGGRWVEPIRGEYFTDHSPINGRQLAEIAKSSPEDVEAALDAAHRAKEGWARMCPAERARILNRVADRLEDNLELLALAETMDNGKPIRETRAADV